MHDWRNFNNVSFESIMVIFYDKSMTTVIHPGTWSQTHSIPLFQDSVFFSVTQLYIVMHFYTHLTKSN